MAFIKDVARPTQEHAPKIRRNRQWFILTAIVVLLLWGGFLLLRHAMATNSPVPGYVQETVKFPIYYPKQSKLPAGYSLDTTSFRVAEAGVIIYSVDAGVRKLIFSEQQSPDSSVIDKFKSSYIPLHNTIATEIGKASFGSAGQGSNLQTIVSLPITNGPWLIVTAPANTQQSEMQQVLQSLIK